MRDEKLVLNRTAHCRR